MALRRQRRSQQQWRKPKFPILGQVQDVDGHFWDVKQIRETKHGFDLLYGSPESNFAVCRWGLPRLIATKSLYDFWDANRTKRDGVIYDLPGGRTTLKRVRHRLGFHSLRDLSKFWRDRIHDLDTLSAREFAARHNVNIAVALDARRKVIGRRTRDLGWWREPSCLDILRSRITLREKGEKLGISISQSHRLTARARQQNVIVVASDLENERSEALRMLAPPSILEQ